MNLNKNKYIQTSESLASSILGDLFIVKKDIIIELFSLLTSTQKKKLVIFYLNTSAPSEAPIKEALKFCLNEISLSQNEVADICGLTQADISWFIKGKKQLGIKRLEKLSLGLIKILGESN